MTINITTATPAATPAISRGEYITFQALLYAIACIQNLPQDRQERNNMVDMCSIARRIADNNIGLLLWNVEYHVGYEIDLWPAHGGDEPGGLYTDDDYDTRDAVRVWINTRKARFTETGALSDAPPSEVVKFIDAIRGGREEGEAA